MFETLIYQASEGIAEIVLNRPQQRNALGLKSYAELGRALMLAEADREVRVLVIAGAGSAFCAGADLKEFMARPENQNALIAAEQDLARHLNGLSKPVVAALQGPAVGAGAELALGCDFILMAQSARFALPEIGLGNFLGGGATEILPRLVGLARAREIIFLGRDVSGEEAMRIGLATLCFPDDRFEDEVGAFARRLAAQAPLPMRLAKRQMSRSHRQSFEDVLAAEAEGMSQCLKSHDWQEGLRAFGEKRPPHFKGD
jgi:enoyl-CoA hydratase